MYQHNMARSIPIIYIVLELALEVIIDFMLIQELYIANDNKDIVSYSAYIIILSRSRENIQPRIIIYIYKDIIFKYTT